MINNFQNILGTRKFTIKAFLKYIEYRRLKLLKYKQYRSLYMIKHFKI